MGTREETLQKLQDFKNRVAMLNNFNSAMLFGIVEVLSTDQHALEQFGTVGQDLFKYVLTGEETETI